MTFFLLHIVLNLIFSVCIISTSITVYEVGWVLIFFTSPGQIKARFYSLIYDKKNGPGTGMYVKARPSFIHSHLKHNLIKKLNSRENKKEVLNEF